MKKITLACLFIFSCFGWQGYAQCTTYSLPFTETFDDTDTPTCWTESGDNSWDFSLSAGYAATAVTDHTTGGGTDYAWMDGSDNGDGETSTLTSPEIDISTLTIPALEFYAFSHNTDDDAINTLDVEFYDGANWNRVVHLTTLLGANWTRYLIDLRPFTITGDVQVRFTVTGNSEGGSTFYNDILIDDVSFINGTACMLPIALDASSVTANSASLNWKDGNGATKWDIEFLKAGTVPTGTSTYTGVTKPYSATGLTGSTGYEFYVRASCGGSKTGWAGPYGFKTACATYSLPFVETFDDADIPTCWEESGDNSWDFSTSAGYAASDVDDHTVGGGTSYAWMDGNDNEDKDKSTLTSPNVDVSTLTNPALEFYAFSNNTDDTSINILDVDFYDGANWNNVLKVNQLLGSNWTLFLLDLSTYTITGDVQVRFTITGNANGGDAQYNDILIDDVSFVEGPTCFPPLLLKVSNIKDTSAKLAWTDTDAAKWDIEVVAAGTAPTGTPTDTGVTKKSYNKTGLTSNTDYEFYVRADCDNGDTSSWAGPYAFTTECSVEIAPWFDDIENHTVEEDFSESQCWTTVAVDDEDYGWNVEDDDTTSSNTGPTGANSGKKYFAVDGGDGSTDDEAELYTPTIDIDTLATPALKFYYHMYGSDMGDLHVDIFDGTKWVDDVVLIQGEQQTSGSDPWLSKKIKLTGYSGEIQVRFRAENTQSGYESDISLDDISIEEFLEGPADLVADSITRTTAKINWTEKGKETKWEIEYGPAGFNPGKGTVVVDKDGATGKKLTGLTSGTAYDVYVRSIDKKGDPSGWVGPEYFVTRCDKLTSYPYKQGFEENSPRRLCFQNRYENGATAWKYVKTNQDGSIKPRTDKLMAEFISTERGEATKLVASPLDLTSLTSPQLTFYYANVSWSGEVDELRVYYKTKLDTTWTQIGQNYTMEHTSWTKVTLALPNPSNNYFIAFEGISHYGRGINVDDILVNEAPTCVKPSKIVVTPDIVSADISWEAGGNETTWNVEYGLKGFASGTGTIVADNDGVPGITITGLKPDTEYEVYITAICAPTNMSGQIGPKAFTTNSLGFKNQVFESFAYYPNPVSGQLSLEAAHDIQQIVIYNLLGQEVLKMFPNSLKPTLELNNLRSGVYLMKVTINNSVGVFRVIKE